MLGFVVAIQIDKGNFLGTESFLLKLFFKIIY